MDNYGSEKKELDDIEREYTLSINAALQRGENDKAFDLSIGLKQYQEMFKN